MTFVHTSSRFPKVHQTFPASQENIYIYIDHFIFPTLTNIHPQLTKVAYVLNNAVNSLQYLLVKGI